MLFEGFSAAASQFVADLYDSAGVLLIALAAAVDPELASAWTGVLARSLARDSPALLLAGAAAGSFLRSWLIYEAARRGALTWRDGTDNAWKSLENKLAQAPLRMTAGLQFCFALRWLAPIAAARTGMTRARFCSAALIGITLWTAAVAAAAFSVTYLCYPGLLGLNAALAAIAGELLTALIAVYAFKAVLQRLFERLQKTNDK